jgi:hypothetical protein
MSGYCRTTHPRGEGKRRGGGGQNQRGASRGVETAARGRSELGRIQGSRGRVAISLGGPLKSSFGPGGLFGALGGWRNQGGGGRPRLGGSGTALGHPMPKAMLPRLSTVHNPWKWCRSNSWRKSIASIKLKASHPVRQPLADARSARPSPRPSCATYPVLPGSLRRRKVPHKV